MEKRKKLRRDLAVALDKAVKRSCPSTGPLWFEHSWRLRKYVFCADTVVRLPEHLADAIPKSVGAMAKGTVSKYRAQAGWRHACILAGAVDSDSSNIDARVVDAVYFQPCEDVPPFNHQAKMSSFSDEFERKPRELQRLRWEGCANIWCTLCNRAEEAGEYGRYDRAAFIGLGLKPTLAAFQKLDDNAVDYCSVPSIADPLK
jgi:hypothetical protein